MKVDLPHIDRMTDRHGKARYYHRRRRGKRTPLPGLPGSKEFLNAYHAAEAQVPTPTARQSRAALGSMGDMALAYYASADYQRLAKSSKAVFRNAIEALLDKHQIRDAPVAGMQRKHVQAIIASRMETPAAAANDLKRLRSLIRVALDKGLIDRDPSAGIKSPDRGTEGHHTWTESEIVQFESHWAIGTMQRAAMALLLLTGQRVSDVARMTWRQIEDGVIEIRQRKGGRIVTIPVLPSLHQACVPLPKRCITVLSTHQARPYTDKGLSNMVSDAIHTAGLPDHCVGHGLRKAAARRLAEAGCTPHEIASITGHASLSQVQHYTKAADREGMARKVVGALDGTRDEQNVPTPIRARPKPGK